MSLAQRSSLSILISVVRALTYREFKSRFGGYHLGYLWAVLEPMSHVIVISVIFGVRGGEALPGIDFPMFVLTGIIPFDLFIKTLGSCTNAVSANQGLFVYRQVRPFDCFLTRAVVELIVHWVAFLLLIGIAWWMGYEVVIHDPLAVVALLLMVSSLGLGCGLIVGTAAGLVLDVAKILPWITRPLYFISGIIFPVVLIPHEYLVYMAWNPLLHATELMRAAYFGSYLPLLGSWSLLLILTLAIWFTGLLVYRRYRFALVMS